MDRQVKKEEVPSYEIVEEKIKEIEELINKYPELEPWRVHLERAYERIESEQE